MQCGEVGFEQDGGRDLIDEGLAVEAISGRVLAAVGVEQGVGFPGGEPLVEDVMLEGGVLLKQGVGEGEGLCGLRAGRAVAVQRVAYDEGGNLVATDEARDRFQIGVQRFAVDGEQRTGEQVERVGKGEPDATVTDVEGEGARKCHFPTVAGLRRVRVP